MGFSPCCSLKIKIAVKETAAAVLESNKNVYIAVGTKILGCCRTEDIPSAYPEAAVSLGDRGFERLDIKHDASSKRRRAR